MIIKEADKYCFAGFQALSVIYIFYKYGLALVSVTATTLCAKQPHYALKKILLFNLNTHSSE